MKNTFKKLANCYTIEDYRGKTNIRVYQNTDGEYTKIHVQNYKNSNFGRDFKIIYKYGRYYKLTKTAIYCQDFEKILKDIEDDMNGKGAGVGSLVLHKILDEMRE